jgi:hypothetical protein
LVRQSYDNKASPVNWPLVRLVNRRCVRLDSNVDLRV